MNTTDSYTSLGRGLPQGGRLVRLFGRIGLNGQWEVERKKDWPMVKLPLDREQGVAVGCMPLSGIYSRIGWIGIKLSGV